MNQEFMVRFYLDGDQWCAVFPDFTNLQECPVGFGQDCIKALVALLAEATDYSEPPQNEQSSAFDNDFWKALIDRSDQVELARLRRFAPAGHPVFTTFELSEYFNVRFKELGGMTPEISKQIGWGS